ncbi:hypothetical protein IW261DRAFT_1405834 [Armillaria novae-zelandiae]|uniref:Uncharacterized protein n=1 Tax=Armillaria novae-zelandiae TaxID=153914 RepID=A0AA39U065_9AGAR|nr:hypothetical protein IW261DRAFT_1405834 [Armillaria novae-zelandiae]
MSSSPTENASYPLALDPGTPRRHRSACSCCKWSAVVIGLLTILLVCVSIFRLHPLKFVDTLRHPHKTLYHNGSLEEQAVVQPLIDDEQLFDIAVSVWLRAPKEEEEEWRKLSPMVDNVIDKSDPNYDIYLKGDKKLLYTPLYSDVAFHGVSLKDKSVFADVHFQIPTSRFLDKNLTTSDLRGTFVLIPSSKSLLKHVTNFSSWMPDAVFDNLPPVRSWPFPLGSSFHTDKTLADLAVDSFGISVPLLQFSEIPSRCANSSANTTDQAASTSNDTVATSLDSVKEDTPAYKYHPHVVKRTKLHVVDETHLFGKEAYDKAHQSLRSTSCGQYPGISVKPSRNFCKKLSFSTDGVFRTSLELNVPNANGDYERRWAYGPFMDTIPASTGPKDIVPIPVNRENCSFPVDWPVDAPEVSELMDITWRISFSGLSPAKHLLSTVIPPQPIGVNSTRTDFETTSQQNIAELIDGLRGVRFDDESHPRRRVIISTILTIAAIPVYILEVLYWFTRVHTVAISTTGTLLRASSLAIGSSLVLDLKSENSALQVLVIVVLWFIFDFQLPIHMFRIALRLEFDSTRRSILGTSFRIPVIRRVPKTHKERSSERLDKRTNWKVILCFMLVIYYIATPLKYDLIDALHPPRPEQEVSESYEYVIPGLHAINITAMILQIMLNHRSQVFAGNYRTSTYLNLLVHLLNLMGYVPAIVGRPESRASFSLNDCIVLTVDMIQAVQAFTLPNARMEDDEDDK